MQYNLNSLEQEYDVKLDEVQKQALSSLLHFIESEQDTSICLSGKAGCGKTLILSMLTKILTTNGYKVSSATPTNKSKIILEHTSNKKCNTIHGLLGLRPDLNILDFDASKLIFKPISKSLFQDKEILIIDECSMINDSLYENLISKARNHDNIIIWCGDECQLRPVNQDHISKTFSNNEVIKLEKVYRQKEGKIYKVLDYLRNKPLYKFKSVEDNSGSIIMYNNILQMLSDFKHLFKFASDSKDLKVVKLITYTNKRLTALNQTIRKMIYNSDLEYNYGEILTGYDNCKSEGYDVFNSMDYRVENCYPASFKGLVAHKLFLTNQFGQNLQVKILSRNNSEDDFSYIAKELEKLRQRAIKTKSANDWRKYYQMNDSFLTPVDLIYDGRIIKRKSLDYGYCISAHKSQSSTYQIILIDMENIYRCPNKEELRQMQYVALSRTSSDIIIYQKND